MQDDKDLRQLQKLEQDIAEEQQRVMGFKRAMIDQGARTGNSEMIRMAMQSSVKTKKTKKIKADIDFIKNKIGGKKFKILQREQEAGNIPKEVNIEEQAYGSYKSKKEKMVEKAFRNNNNKLMRRIIAGEFDGK